MLIRQLLGAPTLQAAACTAAAAPATLAASRRLASSLHGSGGKKPRDQAGSLAAGPRSVVQAPGAASALADPAAADAPVRPFQRLKERAQDLLRPAYARGHAYHYAEDSARAVLREQLESCKGKPALEEM